MSIAEEIYKGSSGISVPGCDTNKDTATLRLREIGL